MEENNNTQNQTQQTATAATPVQAAAGAPATGTVVAISTTAGAPTSQPATPPLQAASAPQGDSALRAELERVRGELASVMGQRQTRPVIGVMTPDINHVLQAYRAEQNPRTRGQIYTNDIKPLLDKGGEFPVSATQTLGVLVGDIVTQRALDLLEESMPWLKGVTTDFTDEAVAYGQSVKTRLITPPAVSAYSTSTGYAVNEATVGDVTVTINQHKGTQLMFTANDMSGTRRNLIEEQSRAMMYAIAKDIADTLGAIILAATFTNKSTETLAGFDRKTVVDMATALTNRKVSMFSRMCVLNPSYYGQLLKDASIVSLALAESWGAARDGKVPDVAGAKILQWADLPTNSQNLVGFMCAPSALAIAARLPNDYTMAAQGVPETALVNTITNPHTGLSVMQTRFVNHVLGASYTRVALMFGVAAGQPLALQRLVSA